VEESDHRADNPYTEMEGYTVYDISGEEIGVVEETVYDAPSDVLKYLVVGGRPIPAEGIDVDAGEKSVSLPYSGETVESAPEMEELSGAFDAAVQEHFGSRSRERPDAAKP
jgi:sporulation protein YlmC with PRC-barrel domain